MLSSSATSMAEVGAKSENRDTNTATVRRSKVVGESVGGSVGVEESDGVACVFDGCGLTEGVVCLENVGT